MRLSFLIQLLLLIILIVGVYLIFTNGVSGRNKLILIVFLVVIGIYLFNKLPFLRGYNEVIENPVDAKIAYTITSDKLKKSNGDFSISSWIYINDWNEKYGQEKIILKMGDLISMKLGEYENNLKITLGTYEESKDNHQATMFGLAQGNGYDTATISQEYLECSGGHIYQNYTGGTSGYLNTGGITVDASLPANDISCDNTEVEDVDIENINIQKWVHIIVTVNDRVLDVYINGKLVTSKAFNNIINTAEINSSNLVITPSGGYGGFISKVQYYPLFITPKKAWEIYRGGFGDAFASALDKYNLSVTFYEDQVEKKKYWVF